MDKKMSPAALEILDGLHEALCDAKGMPVDGLKNTVVYRVNPKSVRESLHMSQQEFSSAFGIPFCLNR